MLPSVSLKHAGRNSNFPVLVSFTASISGSVDFLPINMSINNVLSGISVAVDTSID